MSIPATILAVDDEKLARKGIGGTDIAAILGVSPYRTVHDVWLDKMGLSQYTPSEAARWGILLEPIIAQEYAAKEGVKVYQPQPPFVRHPDVRWALGKLDYVHQGAPIGLDCKLSNPRYADRWGEEGTEDVPEDVLIQCQWYLYITGFKRWDVALLMGYRLQVFHIQPSADLQNVMLEEARRFWQEYVMTKQMPPVDYSLGAKRMLEGVFPQSGGTMRTATAEETALVLEFQAARQRAQDAEQVMFEWQNRVRAAIGEDDGLQGAWGKVTWRRSRDGRAVDWEAVARALQGELSLKSEALRQLQADPSLLWTLDAYDAVVAQHSIPKPGSRRFLPTITGTPEPSQEGAKT